MYCNPTQLHGEEYIIFDEWGFLVFEWLTLRLLLCAYIIYYNNLHYVAALAH